MNPAEQGRSRPVAVGGKVPVEVVVATMTLSSTMGPSREKGFIV